MSELAKIIPFPVEVADTEPVAPNIWCNARTYYKGLVFQALFAEALKSNHLGTGEDGPIFVHTAAMIADELVNEDIEHFNKNS